MKSWTFAFAAAALAGSAAAAQGDLSVSGRIDWSFGTGAVDETYGTFLQGSIYESPAAGGTFGFAFEGGLGMQVSATSGAETFTDSPRGENPEFIESQTVNLRVNYDLGQVVAGVFAGQGTSAYLQPQFPYFYYHYVSQWYGVEAARDFGNWQIAGQVGLSSAREEDTGDFVYRDQAMGGVEIRYFLDEDFMLAAGFDVANGIVDAYINNIFTDVPMVARSWSVSGAARLGGSDFFLTAEYRKDELDAGASARMYQSRFSLGVTLLLGGSSLRDSYGATPMIDNSAVPLVPLLEAMEDYL